MKTKKKSRPNKHLAPDSQMRLVAYATAAGLGALFTGQSAKAQVTESPAFAPYPAFLPTSSGTNTTLIPMDVTGNGTTDFEFVAFGQGLLPNANQLIDVHGTTTNLVGTNVFLNTTPDGYLGSTFGGVTIDASTGEPAGYQPRLAISYMYNAYNILDDKFLSPGALAFEFVSSVDNQVHFGYMDVQVNYKTNDAGFYLLTGMTVYDVYYNQTPNAGITVPGKVAITAITNLLVGAANDVTINFTSNTNAPASAFTLLTSPTLGPSANWTPDANAVISLIQAADPHEGSPSVDQPNLAHLQAVTTNTGGPSQFYRIKQN